MSQYHNNSYHYNILIIVSVILYIEFKNILYIL